MTAHSRARRGQDGSVAAEVVLLTPALLLVLLLVVGAGRLVAAHAEVDAAARDAARSASVSRTLASAQTAATTSAQATLAAQGCQNATVTTDTSRFTPGGTVTVQVACQVSFADLTLLPLPGGQTLTATFTHPIDVFRGAP